MGNNNHCEIFGYYFELLGGVIILRCHLSCLFEVQKSLKEKLNLSNNLKMLTDFITYEPKGILKSATGKIEKHFLYIL